MALLAWLYANVLGNLIASLIWAVPGALMHLHTRRQLRRLHAKHDQFHDRLTRTDTP